MRTDIISATRGTMSLNKAINYILYLYFHIIFIEICFQLNVCNTFLIYFLQLNFNFLQLIEQNYFYTIIINQFLC
jgi:hypothetical protein